MATSSKSTSIRKAQVPVSCYFCKGQDIKWKCEDCNVRMCKSCKVTIHQGLPSTQDHEAVSIQDISKSSPGFQAVTSVVVSSVFNSYTTTLPGIHSLLCSDDDLLYFQYGGTKSDYQHFFKGKLLKSSIKILQTFKIRIYDMAMNQDGEILFQDYDNNKIQMLSPTGEIKSVLETSQMMALAVHINKENEVIVGIREPGAAFPATNFSVRQVIIFGGDYQRKGTLEFDKKGNKLFSYAARIRTDSKNVVYVIDHFDSDKNGRIVAVDRNCRLKFIYDEHTYSETFQPSGITITPSDNIVVADYQNDALHVINSNGELLGLQFIFKDLNINDAYSLCFDAEGYLIIGCCAGENEDFGKIWVVKIVDSLV
ncbi:protein wech-like [Mytilus edulis]|uniref:protein wech-like n=1 Tax=Mytilus edulis TaxID=6550 RepID=UPI0039EE669B